jgi:hypothetical protein
MCIERCDCCVLEAPIPVWSVGCWLSTHLSSLSVSRKNAAAEALQMINQRQALRASGMITRCDDFSEIGNRFQKDWHLNSR